MSKRAGQKKSGGKRFVMLELWLLKTEAWQSLSTVSRAAYIEIAQLYKGNNNGRLSMSLRRLAGSLHVGKSTAERAISELTERGFIEVAQPSGFMNKCRLAAEYRLTAHFCDRTNQPAKKTFCQWHEKENPRSRHRDTTVPPQGHEPPKTTPKPSDGPVQVAEKRGFGT